MSKRNQITYRKPDPPFLRRIRERKETLGQADQKDLEDRHDEAPTVLITEDSNVTKEEQEDYAEKLTEAKPVKILFKKPVKKTDKEEETGKQSFDPDRRSFNVMKETKLKRTFNELDDAKDDKPKKIKQNEKNSRLLSFDDEEF